MRLQRGAERFGRDTEADGALRVDLGGHPDRPRAGHHQPHVGRDVGVAREHDLVARRQHRQHGRVVAARRAVAEQEGAVCAPEIGRQVLGLTQDTVLLGRVEPDVGREQSLAHEVVQARVGRLTTAVRRAVEGHRFALAIALHRVDEGRDAVIGRPPRDQTQRGCGNGRRTQLGGRGGSRAHTGPDLETVGASRR